MALTTNFNADPYYDDYNADNAYYRILFRPGFAVQAREVTQLQTILQKQVERHGSHTFQDGSIVLGCELNYDNNLKTIQLETAFSGENISTADFANFLGSLVSNWTTVDVANKTKEAFGKEMTIEELAEKGFDYVRKHTVEKETSRMMQIVSFHFQDEVRDND